MSKSVEEQIAEIHASLTTDCFEKWRQYRNKKMITFEQYCDYARERHYEATQAILNIIDTEVIGEDETFSLVKNYAYNGYKKDDTAKAVETRNELRQAQRNKLRREQ